MTGRPNLPVEVRRTERLQIRLSKSELESIRAVAGDQNISYWAREFLLDMVTCMEDNRISDIDHEKGACGDHRRKQKSKT